MSLGLEVRGVEVRYGGVLALDDVSLNVPPGQLHAVIGPNGAGKSTLFGVISGEHRPVRGTVHLGDHDVTGWPAHRRVHAGLARAFQVARVFPRLTVLENVLMAVLASRRLTRVFWRPAGDAESLVASRDALAAVGMGALEDRVAGELAQGDRKRLEIGMALCLNARALLLDEPTAGMSPEETETTVALIGRLHRERGLTVLLTEHDMNVVFRLAEVLTVMHRGRLLVSGPPEDVRNRPEVAEIYLGRRRGR
ncbi:MAG TPA: ABC transporter ATP-binding protein [Candidatus Dormibacteraeota bacterium]|nr:ABC transporter ATP-binding protein [Candidatus Dormibacteraeota bacterium]